MSDSIKKRAPNFTSKEKNLLLTIIHNFKNVVENKKTDSITWKEKDEVWEKIKDIFNAQNPAEYSRTKESLRKLYDNVKKQARKDAAEEKQELLKTGGGKPIRTEKDPTTDLVLEVISPKTVFGLENPFDSDETVLASTPSVQSNSEKLALANVDEKPARCSSDWADYSAKNLRKPLSSELKHTWTKRRRPGIQQLNSSQLSEQYSKLAELKMEYYRAETENVVKRRIQDEEIANLKKKPPVGY